MTVVVSFVPVAGVDFVLSDVTISFCNSASFVLVVSFVFVLSATFFMHVSLNSFSGAGCGIGCASHWLTSAVWLRLQSMCEIAIGDRCALLAMPCCAVVS